MEGSERRAVGLLRGHRDFRQLWSADAISQLGTRIDLLALPLLALLQLGASAFQVSLVRTLQTLAVLLIGLPAGAWCDRMRSRPVLMAADLGRAALFASIPVAALFGALTIWQLDIVVFAAGVLTVFFDVSQRSYLPRLIGREHLMEGNTRLQANQSVAAVAGSTIAGALVQLLGASFAVLTDAVSYLASALLVRSIRTPEPRPISTRRPLCKEIVEGLRFVIGHPIIRPVTFFATTEIFFQSGYNAVSTVFLVRVVHLSAGLIGILSSLALLAAVLSAFLARRIAAMIGQARALWLTGLGMGMGALLVPLTAPGWRLICYVLGNGIWSFSIILCNIIEISFCQRVCPDELLGRMNATINFLGRGAIPLGSAFGGALTAVLSLRSILWLTAVGVLAAVLWLSPLLIRRAHRDAQCLPGKCAPSGRGGAL